MLERLKEEVWRANLALPENNLVVGTTGNVSGMDRENRYVVIKPSGVPYKSLKQDDLVVVDLEGRVVEGKKKPSVDTPHHLYIYRNLEDVGSVIHTHSPQATMFAMLEQPIPVYNTTHADIFGVEIPCTPYVGNQADHIGKAILKYRKEGCPAILLGKHGVFTFDEAPAKALRASIMLEYVAMTAKGALELASTLRVKLTAMPPQEAKLWYLRHHGGGYGQSE
ncbi:class II aldolase/adducin family protein [bacterium]|nr:class II aldolase/adducin family protein [bacterium]